MRYGLPFESNIKSWGGGNYLCSMLEIYETPQAPTKPAIGLTCNQSCHSVVPTLDKFSSNSSPWLAMLKVMPLHACFVQAVNMPDGAEVFFSGIVKFLVCENICNLINYYEIFEIVSLLCVGLICLI